MPPLSLLGFRPASPTRGFSFLDDYPPRTETHSVAFNGSVLAVIRTPLDERLA
jgi:hypothetical protein